MQIQQKREKILRDYKGSKNVQDLIYQTGMKTELMKRLYHFSTQTPAPPVEQLQGLLLTYLEVFQTFDNEINGLETETMKKFLSNKNGTHQKQHH